MSHDAAFKKEWLENSGDLIWKEREQRALSWDGRWRRTRGRGEIEETVMMNAPQILHSGCPSSLPKILSRITSTFSTRYSMLSSWNSEDSSMPSICSITGTPQGLHTYHNYNAHTNTMLSRSSSWRSNKYIIIWTGDGLLLGGRPDSMIGENVLSHIQVFTWWKMHSTWCDNILLSTKHIKYTFFTYTAPQLFLLHIFHTHMLLPRWV